MRTPAERFDIATRSLGPGVITFLLLLLSIGSTHIAGMSHFFPLTTAISIYYWTLFRPTMLPTWFIALMGLVQDATTGMPLGLSSLIYILFRMSCLTQRKIFAREAFWAVWVGFGVMSVMVSLGYWGGLSLYHKQFMPFVEGLVQWMLTVSFYPLMHLLFNRIYMLLPKD